MGSGWGGRPGPEPKRGGYKAVILVLSNLFYIVLKSELITMI